MNYKKFALVSIGCLISMSSGSFGMEEHTPEDVFRAKFMWRQDVHAFLSAAWKTGGIKANTWWKQAKYEDSIFKEMSKAVVDCVLNQGYFADKRWLREVNEFSVFRFSGAEPTDIQYTGGNWNALVLYNVIHNVLNMRSGLSLDELLNKVVSGLTLLYSKEIRIKPDGTDMLGNACKDIKRYLKDVRFFEYLKKIQELPAQEKFDPYKTSWRNSIKGDNVVLCRYYQVDFKNDTLKFDSYWKKMSLNLTYDPERVEDDATYDVSLVIPEGKEFSDVYWTLPCRTSSCPNGVFQAIPVAGKKAVFVTAWYDVLRDELPKNYSLDFVARPAPISQHGTMLTMFHRRFSAYNRYIDEQMKKTSMKVNTDPRNEENLKGKPSVVKVTKLVPVNANGADDVAVLQKLQEEGLLDAMRAIYGDNNTILTLYFDNLKRNNPAGMKSWKEACKLVFDTNQKNVGLNNKQKLKQIVQDTVIYKLNESGVLKCLKYSDYISKLEQCSIYRDLIGILDRFGDKNYAGTPAALKRWLEACGWCCQLAKMYSINDKSKCQDIVDTIIFSGLDFKYAELYVANFATIKTILSCKIYKDVTDILQRFQEKEYAGTPEVQQFWVNACKLCNQLDVENKLQQDKRKKIIDDTIVHNLNEELVKIYVKNFDNVKTMLSCNIFGDVKELLTSWKNVQVNNKSFVKWQNVVMLSDRLCQKHAINDQKQRKNIWAQIYYHGWDEKTADLYIQHMDAIQQIESYQIYDARGELMQDWAKVRNNAEAYQKWVAHCVTCHILCQKYKISDKYKRNSIIKTILNYDLKQELADLYIKYFDDIQKIIAQKIYNNEQELMHKFVSFNGVERCVQMWVFACCNQFVSTYSKFQVNMLMNPAQYVDKLLELGCNMNKVRDYISAQLEEKRKEQLTKLKSKDYVSTDAEKLALVQRFRDGFSLSSEEYSNDVLYDLLSKNGFDEQKAFDGLFE